MIFGVPVTSMPPKDLSVPLLMPPPRPEVAGALTFPLQGGLSARLPDRWAGASALWREERPRALPLWARYGMACWTTAQACAQAQVPYR